MKVQFEIEFTYDDEAEKAVLGAALRGALLATELVAENFYHADHQALWMLLGEFRQEGKPLDSVVFLAYLRQRKVLTKVGGASYLATLIHSVPTTANVEHYARIVKDQSFRRRLVEAGQRICDLARSTDDPPEIANEAEQTLRRATDEAVGATSLQRLGDVIQPTWQRYWDQRKELGVMGLATGFDALDGLLGGLMPADFAVVGARPSVGKTSLATAIAKNVASQGKSVGFFSLEMTATQIGDRLVCADVPLDSHLLRTRNLTDEQWDKAISHAADLSALPIYIDHNPQQTTTEIWAKARRIPGLALVIVDYLHLLWDKSSYRASETERLGAMTQNLKAMARDLKVPLLLLCQLSRGNEKEERPPRLSDLRGSGNIEQDADIVLFLHSQFEVINPLGTTMGAVDCIVAKQRNGPRNITIKLAFDPQYARFRNTRVPSRRSA